MCGCVVDNQHGSRIRFGTWRSRRFYMEVRYCNTPNKRPPPPLARPHNGSFFNVFVSAWFSFRKKLLKALFGFIKLANAHGRLLGGETSDMRWNSDCWDFGRLWKEEEKQNRWCKKVFKEGLVNLQNGRGVSAWWTRVAELVVEYRLDLTLYKSH